MASTLAAQLGEIAKHKGPAGQERSVRGKASLLYDYQKAADVDAETLYNIALAGGVAAAQGFWQTSSAQRPRTCVFGARQCCPAAASAGAAPPVPDQTS